MSFPTCLLCLEKKETPTTPYPMLWARFLSCQEDIPASFSPQVLLQLKPLLVLSFLPDAPCRLCLVPFLCLSVPSLREDAGNSRIFPLMLNWTNLSLYQKLLHIGVGGRPQI